MKNTQNIFEYKKKSEHVHVPQHFQNHMIKRDINTNVKT